MNDPLITGWQENPLGQPVGLPLSGFSVPPRPDRVTLRGQYCEVVPLEAGHLPGLFDAFSKDSEGRIWTYMPIGPFDSLADYESWGATAIPSNDPLFFAIVVDGRPLGHATYLRIDPTSGVIEVGFIALSPALQRTRAATEFQYLMMKHAFDLGYRRYEWKCDALNAPSRNAALRLGFTYEGTFRQATHYKGRNRDTAWFSVIDTDWPKVKTVFEAWLNPANFDRNGHQVDRLSAGEGKSRLPVK